ncbi:MAG TPA: glycosyltransferase family 4 protein [Candidatus Acidoferrum sp.]|nr:glycosyltransferase family 4 protein [Candidatus Acidoferrum sp.]
MKLLLYCHFFAPSIGGVENIVLSLARGLVELRSADGLSEFEVTLVTQTPAVSFDDQSLPFAVVRQPTLTRLWSMIRASDVIHLAGPALMPLMLARLARKPVVVEHHGYQVVCPNGLLFHHPTQSACPGHFKLRNYAECFRCNQQNETSWKSLRLLALTFLRQRLCSGAAFNIAPTGHVATRNQLPKSKVIFHGIENPHGADPFAQSKAFNPNSFAYLGRLVTEKGLLVVLEAVRLLRREGYEVFVKIVGDGPERINLQSEIAVSGLQKNFCLTGFLLGDELDIALQDVGTIIMPTLMEETAGLAVIEQMMRGRLVIASGIGGLGEVVGSTGLQFPAGNAVALAECMKKVIQHPAIISSLGHQARERALNFFARPTMIAEHASVYRSARLLGTYHKARSKCGTMPYPL